MYFPKGNKENYNAEIEYKYGLDCAIIFYYIKLKLSGHCSEHFNKKWVEINNLSLRAILPTLNDDKIDLAFKKMTLGFVSEDKKEFLPPILYGFKHTEIFEDVENSSDWILYTIIDDCKY